MSKHLVCPMWASVFTVPSINSDDTYMVKFFVSQKAVCTCPAYRYSGGYDEQTCKHIKQVKNWGCFFVTPGLVGNNDLDAANIVLFSTTQKNRLEINCPGCNEPMIEVTI